MAGLYVHVPFCSQRCVYCDFYFVTTRSKTHAAYVEALLTEMAWYGQQYGEREPLETLYLGGGTPSLLSIDELARIVEGVHRHFDASDLQEVTLELNPENADPAYLQGLRSLGFDRLSIGIQSFFDEDLRFMNRSHDAEEALQVVPLARRAGFDNFSVDLIFGLPDQPEVHWRENLERAARWEVPHLSTYGLTVEPRTPLAKQIQRGLVEPASDDAMNARYDETISFLTEHGYEHYEVSSFARPGARARHNSAYWRHANYLGLGPSAHSFWRGGFGGRGERWQNVRNLRRYEALLAEHQIPVEERELLLLDDLADEYVMLRLRTTEGLELDVLEEDYGVDLLDEKIDVLAELEGAGLLRVAPDRIRLTRDGLFVADAVTARLVG